MGIAAAAAAAFYRDVATTGKVWTIRDAGGFPSPLTREGKRAMPFWSTRRRAERIIANVAAYAGFIVVELSERQFRETWIPGLAEDGLLIGVNWSGARAMGYDCEPSEVGRNIDAVRRLAQEPS